MAAGDSPQWAIGALRRTMKHRKVLVLLAVATTALMASAGGTAMATSLTSPAGTNYTGSLYAASEGTLRIPNSVANIDCNWKLQAYAINHGATATAESNISTLEIVGCKNNWSAIVYTSGRLVIHSILGGPDGTVTWTGATIKFSSPGLTCFYTIDSDVGRLTGSTTTGATATIDVQAELKREGASGSFCEEKPTLTGSLSISTPDLLNADGPKAFHAASQGQITLDNEFAGELNVGCTWTFESEMQAHGSNITDGGQVTSLSISNCSQGASATVTASGSLKIHPISGGPDGTVTWSGANLTTVLMGVSCTYTINSDIGRLTGSTTTGSTAKLDLSGSLPLSSGSLFCGKQVQLTGSFAITAPDALNVTS